MDPAELAEIRRIVDSEPETVDEGLDYLEAIRKGVAYWNDRLDYGLRFVRDKGATLRDIADALDVTTSAVHHRFKVLIRPTESE